MFLFWLLIVMNTEKADCTIMAIAHLKRVLLYNSSNTTAMQESDVIMERWKHINSMVVMCSLDYDEIFERGKLALCQDVSIRF